MGIEIEHPIIGRTARPNFTVVTIGELELAFSYSTIIGIRQQDGHGWRVRENSWGTTTGKHLNYLDGGHKKSRMKGEAFDELALAITNRISNAKPKAKKAS